MKNTISLGKTGIQVSPLGIGTWAWGDSFFWSYGKDYDQNDLKNAFISSVEAGISLFDTAEVYGNGESERLIGQFQKEKKTQVITNSNRTNSTLFYFIC